jgi:hypothetical protein
LEGLLAQAVIERADGSLDVVAEGSHELAKERLSQLPVHLGAERVHRVDDRVDAAETVELALLVGLDVQLGEVVAVPGPRSAAAAGLRIKVRGTPHAQYSSASMRVMTRRVTAGSLGSGEWFERSRSK